MRFSKLALFIAVFLAITGLAFMAAYHYKNEKIPADLDEATQENTSGPSPAAPPAPAPAPAPSVPKQAPSGQGSAGNTVRSQASSQDQTQPMTRKEFQNLAHKALETLPRQSETQALTDDEAHFLPSQILSRSEILTQIVQAVDQNPGLTDDALNFYESCAKEDDLVQSLRARCLTHLKNLAESSGKAVDLTQYPDNIRRISEFMPE